MHVAQLCTSWSTEHTVLSPRHLFPSSHILNLLLKPLMVSCLRALVPVLGRGTCIHYVPLCVYVHVDTMIRAVVIFAEGLFDGESHVV